MRNPTEMKLGNSLKENRSKGFALISVLLLMSLLLILTLGTLSLSVITLRDTNHTEEITTARANAIVAMMIALGELQKTAGPDQRATAAADILSNTSVPSEGHAHWLGVWDTSDYNQSEPDEKTFLGWLVSGEDTLSSEEDANSSAGSDDLMIFEGDTNENSVMVPKVNINNSSGPPGKYAYWVEDNGLKADLSWSETDTGDDERDQAARLASTPGADYGVFEGPFSGISYPLELGDTNSIVENINKAVSISTVPLAAGATSDQSDWLQENRHNVTVGSLGVMADMKLGGLKRDLSLAFEMDGDTDVSGTSFPELFSQQDGEFVNSEAGADRLASEHLSGGMRGVYDRFLYRDHSGGDGIFSDDIANSYTDPHWASVRGPNWWALRDYANLYKRLSGSSGDYSMVARSYYPNTSARKLDDTLIVGNRPQQYTLGEITRAELNGFVRAQSGGSAWNTELASTGNYVFRPANGNYAPISLGSVCYFSLKVGSDGALEFIADPVFYFWNPYNRTITAENLGVQLELGFPGDFKFDVSSPAKDANGDLIPGADPTVVEYGPESFSSFTGGRVGGTLLTYFFSGLSMEPGEVLAFSPPPGETERNATLTPGNEPTESTGLVIREFPAPGEEVETTTAEDGTTTTETSDSITWEEVQIGADDTVTAFYQLENSRQNFAGNSLQSRAYRQHTSFPVGDVDSSDLSSRGSWGDEVQGLLFWVNDENDDAYKIDIEADSAEEEVGVEFSASDLGSKSLFGALSYQLLAADAANSTEPVEVFAQFNPNGLPGNERAFDSRCDPNYTFQAVFKSDSGGFNGLTNELGIDFPGAVKNAFWGGSYSSNGSTHIPMTDIPSSPLVSLVQFSNASAMTTKSSEVYQAVGNSLASVMVSPISPYAVFDDNSTVNTANNPTDGLTAADASWLLNDVLFDRYFLSGIAPEYSLSGGYTASGSLNETLTSFYGSDFKEANASPVLRPYIPFGKTAEEIITELDDTVDGQGYMKMAAYSLINGLFNVNSTSVEAWAALLQGNKDLAVEYANSGTDTDSGTPFPSGADPAFNSGSQEHWSGFSRLDDDDISDLAEEIVNQVKLRGPFMSLSDFVNHRVGGSSSTDLHYMGALQAAIEEVGINSSVVDSADGSSPNYTGNFTSYYPDPAPLNDRQTTTGIAGDITQAKLLLPLATRLNARSDTFTIRAYGEALSDDGTEVLATAMCEAVVQRFPEYVDTVTDSSENEPWDQALENPLPMTILETTSLLNEANTRFGRRFRVVAFKWLSSEGV